MNQEIVFIQCLAQIQEKGNILLHRKLHWEINAALFQEASKPAGGSSLQDNAPLHHPLQQCVCLFFAEQRL